MPPANPVSHKSTAECKAQVKAWRDTDWKMTPPPLQQGFPRIRLPPLSLQPSIRLLRRFHMGTDLTYVWMDTRVRRGAYMYKESPVKVECLLF